jgi:hypothetical protein
MVVTAPSLGLLGPAGCSTSSTFSNSSSDMPAHPSSVIVSRSRCIVAGSLTAQLAVHTLRRVPLVPDPRLSS